MNDLGNHRIVELLEEASLPRCYSGARAFADGFAAIGVVVAPVENDLEYFTRNLMRVNAIAASKWKGPQTFGSETVYGPPGLR